MPIGLSPSDKIALLSLFLNIPGIAATIFAAVLSYRSLKFFQNTRMLILFPAATKRVEKGVDINDCRSQNFNPSYLYSCYLRYLLLSHWTRLETFELSNHFVLVDTIKIYNIPSDSFGATVDITVTWRHCSAAVTHVYF